MTIADYEFRCVKCGTPVAKLISKGKDSPNSWMYDIKHYDNWNPPINGKITCKKCEN